MALHSFIEDFKTIKHKLGKINSVFVWPLCGVAAVRITRCLRRGDTGAGITVGGLHDTVKLLSSAQAQVIQSRFTVRQIISPRVASERRQNAAR